MSKSRHLYVAFYPDDWLAGTARMSRLHKSVYFDVCLYIWDFAQPCPESELRVMLGDLPNWQQLVDDLLATGKLTRNADGSLENARALSEARQAYDLWVKKSEGGKKRWSANSSPESTPPAELIENRTEQIRTEKNYRWRGKTIRLTEDDYQRWRKSFRAIPDFDAELERVDASLDPENKKWFSEASAKLNAKHQKLLAEKAQKQPQQARSESDRYQATLTQAKRAYAEKKDFLRVRDLSAVRVMFERGDITAEEATFNGYRTTNTVQKVQNVSRLTNSGGATSGEAA